MTPLCAAGLIAFCAAFSAAAQNLTPIEKNLIDRVSADSLRGHVSFLASDLLEGRDTPSKGLDIAAEYIAAQFRRFGLEPMGDDDSYFQMSSIESDAPETASFTCTLMLEQGESSIPAARISVTGADGDVTVDRAVLHRIPWGTAFRGESAGPTVIVTNMPPLQSVPRGEMRDFFGKVTEFMNAAREMKAVAILNIDPTSEEGAGPGARGRMGRLFPIPVFTVHGKAYAERLGLEQPENRAGDQPVETVTLRYQAPERRETAVKNVVGLLRGSDPKLAETYILITGHYDHVGRGQAVEGDDIYNGANDDASGTTSVMELARVLSELPQKPKRSILFMCFYGEERGLLGSRHYGENPIVPLKDTIAMVNLEHMGRTDDSEGLSEKRIMPTGFDFSTLTEWFVKAGEDTGVEVFHHPRNSGSFFARSDNVALAMQGIPAHTFCTAFIFPDYHGAGDHWDRIDYDNMAAANRAMALGVWRLANDAKAPEWNAEHRSTARYIEAWKKLHGGE